MPDQTSTRWGTVFLILLAGVVGAAQLGKLPGALPEIQAQLEIDLVTAGWVISSIVAIGAVGGVAAGTVGDRYGHRLTFLIGIASIAAGGLAGSFAVSSFTLILSRCVEGIGYIAVITVAPMLIARATSESDRDMGFGVWSFYMPVGMASMVALSPFLIRFSGGWQGLWIINGIVTGIALVAVAIALRGDHFAHRGRASKHPLADIRRTLCSAGPWAISLGFGAYSLVYLSSMAFLPTFLTEREGFSIETAAILIGIAIFMNAPGCLVGGWLMKRNFSPWAGIALGYLCMSICAAGLFQADIGFELRYSLALALPFFGGLIPPIVLNRAQVHATSPALLGTTMGLVIQVISFGQLIGPPIMAALIAASGNWQSGAWLTVSACAIGLTTALWLRNLDRRSGLV